MRMWLPAGVALHPLRMGLPSVAVVFALFVGAVLVLVSLWRRRSRRNAFLTVSGDIVWSGNVFSGSCVPLQPKLLCITKRGIYLKRIHGKPSNGAQQDGVSPAGSVFTLHVPWACVISVTHTSGECLALSYIAASRKPQTEIVEITKPGNVHNVANVIRRHVFGEVAVSSEPAPKRRVLVILNPVSGTRQARAVLARKVLPIFRLAPHITIDVIETHSAGHAHSIAKGLDLTAHDCIACVGGDGILSEVVNGLMAHSDVEKAASIPLAIIPCGSGNGLATSLQIGVEGHTIPMDLFHITQAQRSMYAFLHISYGIISDVDFGSEGARWMGGIRFHLYGVLAILFPKRYPMRVSFTISRPPEAGSLGINGSIPSVLQNPSVRDAILHGSKQSQPGTSGNLQVGQCGGRLAEATHLPNGDVRFTVEGDFGWVHAANTKFFSADMGGGRFSSPSDGCADLSIIGGRHGRMANLRMMLAIEDGSHYLLPSCDAEYYKVASFSLETPPREAAVAVGGVGLINVDGEAFPGGETAHVTVVPSRLRILCSSGLA